MNINNKSSVNFNGFNNVLATNLCLKGDNKISLLSLQVNNVGKNDLGKWQDIQKKLRPYSPTTDVISFSHILVNDINAYLVNGMSVSVDEKLNCINSKKEEKAVLEFFTFIADLCNRISQTAIFNKNRAFVYRVIPETVQYLTDLKFDNRHAFDIINEALLASNRNINQYAKTIFKDIQDSMTEYLK